MSIALQSQASAGPGRDSSSGASVSPLDSILIDLDRTNKRRSKLKKQLNENIDSVLSLLASTSEELNAMDIESNTEVEKVNGLMVKLYSNISKNKPLSNITKANKEYFAFVSKLGKNIDKNFNREIDSVLAPAELDKQALLSIISDYLIREGKLESQKILLDETHVEADERLKNTFDNIHNILEQLRKKNLDPAIEWAEKNHHRFEKIESNLIFKMHKLQFAEIYLKQGRVKALEYARKHFQKFAANNNAEIQKLMTSLLFDKGSFPTAYSELFDESNWKYLENLLITETCKLLRISPESSLQTVSTAGTLALPKFMKFSSVISSKADWKAKNEIPIEIELGKDYKFHSIFICPVSKEVSTIDNPPMLLKCGHVISEHSLKKIVGSTNKPKFKCPTCPTEQTASEAKRIHHF